MRLASLTNHLQPYNMLTRRRTTINHMFAAAIAPHDTYNEDLARQAVTLLGDDPDGELSCAYCGAPAETWDHVFATVKDSQFSGHGHRLGNLLPCCKPCNSRKGNKPWQVHLAALPMEETMRSQRAAAIESYLKAHAVQDTVSIDTDDHRSLAAIRAEILTLMAEADQLAARIRSTPLRSGDVT